MPERHIREHYSHAIADSAKREKQLEAKQRQSTKDNQGERVYRDFLKTSFIFEKAVIGEKL